MHTTLSMLKPGADGSLVSSGTPSRTRRARPLVVVLAAVGCALGALAPATAPAAGDAAEEPIIELAPVDAVPDAPGAGRRADRAAAADADAAASAAADVDAAIAQDVDGTMRELRATRLHLEAEHARLRGRLYRLEDRRELAEQRLDEALDAIAGRLVVLFEAGEDRRVQALIAARDGADRTEGRALLDALPAEDRALLAEHAAAVRLAASTGAEADAVRLDVLGVGTRLAAVDAAIEDRRAPTAAELARERGDRYSVDADLVFATGPIPGIGYWGAMAGGSMLDGWTGYAAAAVGGVGCEAPEPTLRASGRIELGEASWYGPGFHGNPTANGEPYDQRGLTAAHRTLPFGTIVRVYSSATARCVFVRINDRGPYVDGRIIDLSQAAAERIGLSGVAPVQVEVWSSAGR